MRRFVLAASGLTVLAACQPASNELTDYQKAEIAAEVELLHNQAMDAWRDADFDRGMSYFRNSPEFIFANDGYLITGYEAVYDAFRPAFVNVASQTFTISETQTTVLAPDVVSVMDLGTYIETDTTGVNGPEVVYTYTANWVRRDGEWKIHFAHQSTPNTETP